MLHFQGLEPIDFKGHLCEVKADQELKLRLRSIPSVDEGADEKLTELLVQCFEDDFAKDFVKTKLSLEDKMIIAAYIAGGETAVNRLSKATDGAIEKRIERAIGGEEK